MSRSRIAPEVVVLLDDLADGRVNPAQLAAAIGEIAEIVADQSAVLARLAAADAAVQEDTAETSAETETPAKTGKEKS